MTGKPKAPRLAIQITPELIEDSKQRDSSHCMIAEAVKAAFPTAKHVSVDLQTIRFSDPVRGLRYTYLTPRVAQVGLINFDAGVTPDPFEFQLRSGQVTSSGGHGGRRSASPAKKSEQELARDRNLKRQALIFRQGPGAGGEQVPDRVGGQTPPLGRVKSETPGEKAVAFTRRRQFGLRAIDR